MEDAGRWEKYLGNIMTNSLKSEEGNMAKSEVFRVLSVACVSRLDEENQYTLALALLDCINAANSSDERQFATKYCEALDIADKDSNVLIEVLKSATALAALF